MHSVPKTQQLARAMYYRPRRHYHLARTAAPRSSRLFIWGEKMVMAVAGFMLMLTFGAIAFVFVTLMATV